MVILNEASNLRRYLGAIPAHEQHLPDRPASCQPLSARVSGTRDKASDSYRGKEA